MESNSGDRADRPSGPVLQEVRQGQRVRGHGVALTVPGGVEVLDGPPAFGFPEGGIVPDGVHALALHVQVLLQVPDRVEVGVGPAAFLPAVAVEMAQGVGTETGEVRVAGQEPGAVEQAGTLKEQQVGHPCTAARVRDAGHGVATHGGVSVFKAAKLGDGGSSPSILNRDFTLFFILVCLRLF